MEIKLYGKSAASPAHRDRGANCTEFGGCTEFSVHGDYEYNILYEAFVISFFLTYLHLTATASDLHKTQAQLSRQLRRSGFLLPHCEDTNVKGQ